eukprot:COSAG06_NODE_67420_length_252_cov_0.627451_1_plen_43_part_10
MDTHFIRGIKKNNIDTHQNGLSAKSGLVKIYISVKSGSSANWD